MVVEFGYTKDGKYEKGKIQGWVNSLVMLQEELAEKRMLLYWTLVDIEQGARLPIHSRHARIFFTFVRS